MVTKTMKRFRVIAFTGLAMGFVMFLSTQMPIYAASGSAPSAAPAAQTPAPSADAVGAQTFAKNCAVCHGKDRKGNPPLFPSLLGVGKKMTNPQIVALIHSGKGNMPAFKTLPDEEVNDVVRFLTSDDIAAPCPGIRDRIRPLRHGLGGQRHLPAQLRLLPWPRRPGRRVGA